MKRLIALLLLAVMLIAGCAIPGISVSTSNKAPLINSFVADPPAIAAGTSSTLSWNVSGATSVSIDQGIGNVSLTGTRAVMPSATTVYTLTATNAAGTSVTATAQIIVSAAPTPTPTPTPVSLPVVNYFIASPSNIPAGNSTTLSWSVSNATSVSIDNGVGTVGLSGSTSVWPATSINYTLVATNTAGIKMATTQVVVTSTSQYPPAGLPVINYFTANPPNISAGGSTTLSWNVSNATSVTIDPGIGPVGSAGSVLISPITSSNYTLTATNAIGYFYKTITVIVTGAPAATGWTGNWSSNWGQMSLTQTGNQVTGNYNYDNGQITGTVIGNTLIGTWAESPTYSPPDDAGDVELTISLDGNTFTGQWRYGNSGDWDGSWSGTRVP